MNSSPAKTNSNSFKKAIFGDVKCTVTSVKNLFEGFLPQAMALHDAYRKFRMCRAHKLWNLLWWIPSLHILPFLVTVV